MSADKKTATVELFYAMKDGVTYDVTVKGYDKAAFVASAGEPVAVNVWAQDENYKTIVAGQVTVGKLTTLKYNLIDANGVDVTADTNEEKGKITFTLNYNGKSNNNYTMSYYASNAVFDFVEIGDYAVVTAEYVEYDYATGTETRVTSPEVTFYGVAKQNVTIKSVAAYTTQTKDWFDFGNANHDVVKLSQNNNLALKVVLADGKELVVSRQGQTILDDEKIYRENGYVTVEVAKSSEDLIAVDKFGGTGLPADDYADEDYKITLYPRKTGVAQLMVYYNAYLADGNIQKMAVAPITIQVKAAPTLSAIQFNWSGNNNSATVVLPNTPDNADLANGKFTVQLVDQYGDRYTNASVIEFDGVDNRADELAYEEDLFTLKWWNDEAAGEYSVDGAKVKAKLAAMNTRNQAIETLSGQFKFIVKAQDNSSKAIVTNTLVIDMKGRTATGASVVATDVEGQTWGGNIARFINNDPYNAKDEKSITFSVFEKMNGANIDYVNIEPYYTIDNIDTAATGYYFRVFKDSVDVTKKLLEDTADAWDNEYYQGTFATGAQEATPFMSYEGNSVTLRFSAVKADYDNSGTSDVKYVAAYDLTGAGNYTFQVYYVGPSRLDNTKQVSTLVSTASKNVTASNDPGKYTLVGRDSVEIKNETGLVPADVAQACAKDLLYCFKIANRNNVQYNKYNGSNSVDKVEFNGTMIPYEINLKNEWQKPNSVFVESITFYETVYEKAGDETIYAAYTVPVNCYVDFVETK